MELAAFLKREISAHRSVADKHSDRLGTSDHTIPAAKAQAFDEALCWLEDRPRGYLPEPGWCCGFHVPGAYCSDRECHLNKLHLSRTRKRTKKP